MAGCQEINLHEAFGITFSQRGISARMASKRGQMVAPMVGTWGDA
jgi:hypothetical protein